jgi:PAS domain S-box-containing protein
MASGTLDDALQETLATFDDPGVPRTTPEVADDLDLGRRSTYDRLRRLADHDHLETKKVGANARVWWRPPSDRHLGSAGRPRDARDASDDDSPAIDAGRAIVGPRRPMQADLPDVLDRMSDGFYALDDDLRFTFVNEHARTRLSIPEDAIGEDIRTTIGTTDAFERALVNAIDGQSPIFFEDYYDPQEAWFENAIYPSETGLTVYFRDVSERVHRERELERYEQILETVDEGIYVVDEDGYFTHANEAYATMTGWSREDLIGTHVSAVVDGRTVKRAKGIESQLAADPQSTATVETRLKRPNGDTWVGEATFALMDVGDGHERIGAVRDVTDRNERERELEVRMQQQSVVAELGQTAIENHSFDAVLKTATERLRTTLGAEFCKVLELDADASVLELREAAGWGDADGRAAVAAAESECQAAHTLAKREPVVVEDLDAHDAVDGPALVSDHDVRSGISTIIGPVDDPWGVLGVHANEPREFAAHDVTFVQSVASILANAVGRARHEDDLRKKREELHALVTLHEVVGGVTGAVIEQSTRAEIEDTVCEGLAATDSYAFAWLGDVDTGTDEVNVRTGAGAEDYLDAVTISVDPADERSDGPTGRAFRTGDVQVTRDVANDSSHGPWRNVVEDASFRASAAIPVTHDDTTYGVLNLYSDRKRAFGTREVEVLTRLGEVVGQAIAAAERKRALLSDELVELEFKLRDVFADASVDADDIGRISFKDVLPLGDGRFRLYGTAPPGSRPALDALLAYFEHWEEVSVRERDDRDAFQVLLSDPPVISAVASLGGYVDTALVEDGDYHLTLHLPPTADVRGVIETVVDEYPGMTLRKRVQITRTPDEASTSHRRLTSDLTDRQRDVLEAAYYAGYFEWPREANGEAVATSLDVSPPTFHQHLRKAQKGVLDALFS